MSCYDDGYVYLSLALQLKCKHLSPDGNQQIWHVEMCRLIYRLYYTNNSNNKSVNSNKLLHKADAFKNMLLFVSVWALIHKMEGFFLNNIAWMLH